MKDVIIEYWKQKFCWAGHVARFTDNRSNWPVVMWYLEGNHLEDHYDNEYEILKGFRGGTSYFPDLQNWSLTKRQISVILIIIWFQVIFNYLIICLYTVIWF